ncbi:DUF2330 domain-containing protein [Nocardia sp. NPDC057440]|uniref:DUF2330 domain-containing protein n=1 Tax=Nocardia sp. NPDC057440 TaxID=3346134 RepID=UPI00366AE514
MRLTIAVRLATVAAALLACTGIGVAAPASACACGGVASARDETASVGNEIALAAWDGRSESILLQLAMHADSGNAALIVPTPTPATVAAGSAETFAELRRSTAPVVVTDRRWFGSGSSSDGAAVGSQATPGDGPTVLDQVRLGPLEATTLSGGELDGIRRWLSDNGYEMRPEVTATLEPYLREGWSFVALRLTSDEPLNGTLDPVRLTFDSDRFVYPMRMSGAAKHPQSVRLYLLSNHRLQRTDADAGSQSSSVGFAGRITDIGDPALKQLADNGHDYLTEFSISIAEPTAITTDFTFEAAPTDHGYHRVIHRTEDVQILGLPAGPILLGAAVLAAAGVIIAIARAIRPPAGPDSPR